MPVPQEAGVPTDCSIEDNQVKHTDTMPLGGGVLSCFLKNIFKGVKYWEVALYTLSHGQGLGYYLIVYLHSTVTGCQTHHGGSAGVDGPQAKVCPPCALRERSLKGDGIPICAGIMNQNKLFPCLRHWGSS